MIYTSQLIVQIERSVKAGCTLKKIAQQIGISEKTMQNWINDEPGLKEKIAGYRAKQHNKRIIKATNYLMQGLTKKDTAHKMQVTEKTIGTWFKALPELMEKIEGANKERVNNERKKLIEPLLIAKMRKINIAEKIGVTQKTLSVWMKNIN